MDKDVPTKIPIEWKVTTGKDISGTPLLDLKITFATKFSWHGAMVKENQVIFNYILDAEGTWEGKAVKWKGIMENQMHRVIK